MFPPNHNQCKLLHQSLSLTTPREAAQKSFISFNIMTLISHLDIYINKHTYSHKQGGQYVITILESYGTSLSLLFIVLIETIIVCWLYGTDKFCKNLEEMYGEIPGPYWRYCWKYISPTILLLIFLAACLQEIDKYFTLTIGRYTYPDWAPRVGLLMTGSSICCIPLYAVYYLKTQVTGTILQVRI